MTKGMERADVVVVGARIAGCATAIPLARAGRRVVALDRAVFPSNTLSTHGMWPGTVAELQKLGALERVLALDPPKLHELMIYYRGWLLREHGRAIDGIDYGLCIARTDLDAALVEEARAAGVDVRERTTATGLVLDGGRVVGVRYTANGKEHEIGAALVVGADGRKSRVAELVGAAHPYRGSQNGRGFAYWYMDDPKAGTAWRNRVALWQIGKTSSMVMPMPADRMVVMHMGPAEDIPRYRSDPAAMWELVLREHRHLAERTRGATGISKAFTAADLPAFFRASSGPGWALAGDAGHFKDAVIGQGIRDALEWSRRLGEAAAPSLDDPEQLDRTLRRWEAERDRAVLPTYHWANTQTRVEPEQPLVEEAIRGLRSGHEFADIFSRLRRPDQVITPLRGTLWTLKALARPGADRRRILRDFVDGGRVDGDARVERALRRFRSARPNASENPGWRWPPEPRASGGVTDVGDVLEAPDEEPGVALRGTL